MIHSTPKKEIKLLTIPVTQEMAKNTQPDFVQQHKAPAHGVTQPGAPHQLRLKFTAVLRHIQTLQQVGDMGNWTTNGVLSSVF